MIYTTVSVKTVIARIIRNTGKNLPSEYIDDILEWIPEGIKKLKTRYTLEPCTLNIEVVDHIGALPSGFYLEGVQHEGQRLREGGDIRDLRTLDEDDAFVNGNNELELWETDTTIPKDYSEEAFPDNSYTEERRGEDLVPTKKSNAQSKYYKLVPNYIHTSFETGMIKIYGKVLPKDEEGYPLIPDNENYKEALYWYVLMKLMEAGYEHKIFDWNHCHNMFENKYARRAINEIKYPTVDRMERMYRAFIRLVPPEHFYEDFRVGSEQIQPIRGI